MPATAVNTGIIIVERRRIKKIRDLLKQNVILTYHSNEKKTK